MAEWAPKSGDEIAIHCKYDGVYTPHHFSEAGRNGETFANVIHLDQAYIAPWVDVAPWHSAEELAAMERVIEAARVTDSWKGKALLDRALAELDDLRARAQEGGDG